MIVRAGLALWIWFACALGAAADGIVSTITSAPIFPNGIVRDVRTGLNIYLQTDAVQGLDFMDPAVVGYGIPPGGRLEVELVEGFQRDPAIPLDERAILLVAGTPQQGLPGRLLGFTVKEGSNPNTFVFEPESSDGIAPESMISSAPGAGLDPIRQRGIKIIHVGRNKAFVSRGERGVVEVRFMDRAGKVIVKGRETVEFLQEPRPELFPTNVPHDQRNHNWQRVPVRNIVGVASQTLPIPVIVYEKNEGLGRNGMFGVGVLSAQQLKDGGFKFPPEILRYDGGLILQDSNGDGFLNPFKDTIVGGVVLTSPEGATGQQVLSPMVNEKPFLSVDTKLFNERAGQNIGGAIMQVVMVAGDKPGPYRIRFVLLNEPGNLQSGDGSSYTYTVVAQ